MTAQICETCKWNGAKCYCAPNSTCAGYEPKVEGINMMQVLFGYPLPNNGDRYDLSKEELVELLQKAYDNGYEAAKNCYDYKTTFGGDVDAESVDS